MDTPTALRCLKASWRTRARVLAALFALALCAGLSPDARAQDGWAPLSEPRTHAIMRHALAPGTGDPANFRVDDCSTQRNLDDRGRAQARRIGAAVRRSGAPIDRVLSSEWCRCLDTARLLGLGEVERLPALNSFFRNRSRRGPQTEALRAFLSELPPQETVMLVTHQVNVRALTGRTTRSGEVILFHFGEDGTVTVRGSVRTSARAS